MSSKTFTALSYLQDYADASEKANGALKSSIWQLTKSRRNVRSGILGVDSTTAYTAELVREDLRARIRVMDGGENVDIDLVNEDSTPAKGKTASSTAPEWKVHDVLLELEKSRILSDVDASSLSATSKEDPNPTESTGIRHRKNKKEASDTSPTSSWTMVQEDDLNSDDEDERILRTDPVKFFGGYFTARELKVAQRDAQEALYGYIQAANEAAKLLQLLKEKK